MTGSTPISEGEHDLFGPVPNSEVSEAHVHGRINDFLSAKTVDVTIDDEGKLWVNVDGKCILRVGECQHFQCETPKRNGTSTIHIDFNPKA